MLERDGDGMNWTEAWRCRILNGYVIRVMRICESIKDTVKVRLQTRNVVFSRCEKGWSVEGC